MRTIVLDGPGGGWRVLVPETRRERMRGLRGRPPPGPREGLLLERCRSVHTFGVDAPIAAVLLDGGLEVLDVRTLPPRRVLFPRLRARHVLECQVAARVRAGDAFRRRGSTRRP